MQVNVWNYEGYDIAAPTSGDPWNYFSVVDATKITIEPVPFQIGPVLFALGADYNRLGNGKKTSAGYMGLELATGHALRYVGLANGEYLLFSHVVDGKESGFNRDLFGLINGYQDIYFTYKQMPLSNCLFLLTSSCASRVIEL